MCTAHGATTAAPPVCPQWVIVSGKHDLLETTPSGVILGPIKAFAMGVVPPHGPPCIRIGSAISFFPVPHVSWVSAPNFYCSQGVTECPSQLRRVFCPTNTRLKQTSSRSWLLNGLHSRGRSPLCFFLSRCVRR